MDSEKLPLETKSELPADEQVSFFGLFRIFLTLGAISFGGGVVAYMREYLVRGKHWMEDEDFLDALEISQTLPGLNAINLSVIIGDRMRGTLGAALAVLGMILPGAFVVLVLAVLWQGELHFRVVDYFLTGVAASAVGLLVTLTVQIGHQQFRHLIDIALIALTFIAVSVFHFPLPLVVVLIAPAAIWFYRPIAGRANRGVPHFRHNPRCEHLRH
jgi:chromate transporter